MCVESDWRGPPLQPQNWVQVPANLLVGLVTFGTQVHVQECEFAKCPKSYCFRGSKDVTSQSGSTDSLVGEQYSLLGHNDRDTLPSAMVPSPGLEALDKTSPVLDTKDDGQDLFEEGELAVEPKTSKTTLWPKEVMQQQVGAPSSFDISILDKEFDAIFCQNTFEFSFRDYKYYPF